MAGLGLAAAGFAGRYILRQIPNASKTFNEAMKNLPKFDAGSVANSKYYKGGFDQKMNRREAALILGILFCYFHHKVHFYKAVISFCQI